MLDVLIRIVAHILTPLFFIGLVGSATVVLVTLSSDVIHFLMDDHASDSGDAPR